jgi:hypothetical protein
VTEDDRRETGPSTVEVRPDVLSRRTSTPSVVRLAGGDRVAGRLTLVLGLFLAVAIVKPWPSGPGERPRPNPVAPTPTAIPSIDPLDIVRADCQEPPSWRTYSREAWDRGQLRSWRSLEPATRASSPLDSSIPVVPFMATVLELGFCAPWTGSERPPPGATVRAWQILPEISRGEGRREVPIPLRGVGTTLSLPYGGLFRPPPGADGTRWPPGTWVFEVAGPGWERWWAAELEPADDRLPSGRSASGGAPPQPVP